MLLGQEIFDARQHSIALWTNHDLNPAYSTFLNSKNFKQIILIVQSFANRREVAFKL